MKSIQRNKFFFLGIFAMLVAFLSSSCSPRNRILFEKNKRFNNIVIDSGNGSFAPCEPSISISPVNVDFIVAGSVLNHVYTSLDAGKTWQKNDLKSSFGVYGDPVVRCDGLGNFFYAHLSNPSNKAYGSEDFLDRIVVQKLDRQTMSWSDGSFPKADIKKDHDKHWVTVSPIDNTLLMTWTQFDKYGSKDTKDKSKILFSKSMDNGTSWSESLVINEVDGDCLDDDFTNEGAFSAVATDGSYMVVWARNNKIIFDRSTDGGKTWMAKDREIADQIGGWSMDVPGIDRSNGFPVLKVDHSHGEHRGRVYMSWTDQRNGKEDTDVWLIYSDDNGNKWSNPIKVNTDTGKKHQFFHSMDIDQSSGILYLLFYDRRNHEGPVNDVYLGYSTNGAKSFENIKVSDQSFTSEEMVFFGDYTDLSSVNGRIRPIWTHQEGKVLKIITALIDL